MSFTRTAKLGLFKPAPGSNELWNNVEENADKDKIDTNIGTFICTGTTRPVVPFAGQVCFETDTGFLITWDGSKWRGLNSKVFNTHEAGFPVAATSITLRTIIDKIGVPALNFDYTLEIYATVFTINSQDAQADVTIDENGNVKGRTRMKGVGPFAHSPTASIDYLGAAAGNFIMISMGVERSSGTGVVSTSINSNFHNFNVRVVPI